MSDFENLLNVLGGLSAGVSETCTLRGGLKQVVDAACALLDTGGAALWLVDAAGQTLELSVSHSDAAHLPARMPLDQGLIGQVAAGRQPAVVTNGEFEQEDDPLARSGLCACIGAPLIWNDQLHGVLVVTDDSPRRAFSESDVWKVELLARHGAAVVASDWLERQERQLKQLLEAEQERLFHVQVAIRQIQEQPDLRANLSEVVEALQALGWQRVVLALFSEDGVVERLVTAGMTPADEERYREHIIPPESWQQFVDGNLEQYRLSGVYFVPYGDIGDAAWDARDLVFAPLHLGQSRRAGVIRLEEPVEGMRPVREALRPLDILAGQTAYIVENARLLESVSKSAETLADQVEELSMIHRADRELSAHLDVDRVMRLTMDWALRRTGADVGLLMLMTDDKRGLVPSVTIGFLDRNLFPYSQQNPLPIDQGIMGRAVRVGQTQLVLDVLDDADYVPYIPDARSFLSVPLSMRGEVLGVITLAATRVQAFDAQNVSFLERLARRAAVALDNARLYRQTEQMADDMSVLYAASRDTATDRPGYGGGSGVFKRGDLRLSARSQRVPGAGCLQAGDGTGFPRSAAGGQADRPPGHVPGVPDRCRTTASDRAAYCRSRHSGCGSRPPGPGPNLRDGTGAPDRAGRTDRSGGGDRRAA
jgi:GAF domain-containing protein